MSDVLNFNHLFLHRRKSRAKTVPGILRAAAQLINKYGHSRQSYVDIHTGCMCLSGAIRVAAAGKWFACADSMDITKQCFSAVADTIRPGVEYSHEGVIINVNDGLKHREAVKLLELAAKEYTTEHAQ